VWTLLGTIGSLLVALGLSFLALLVISVLVLVWMIVLLSVTTRSP
jgi:hypothetical protein